MAIRLVIVYSDGTEESVRIRPLGLVAAERQYGEGATNGHSIEAALFAAWYLKGKPLGSLDDWLATIEEVEETGEQPLPLEPEASPEESPT